MKPTWKTSTDDAVASPYIHQRISSSSQANPTLSRPACRWWTAAPPSSRRRIGHVEKVVYSNEEGETGCQDETPLYSRQHRAHSTELMTREMPPLTPFPPSLPYRSAHL